MKKRDAARLLKKCIALIAVLAIVLTAWQSGVIPARAQEAGDVQITIDGKGEDWNYITPVFSGGGIITKLSAFTKDGMLYGKMVLSTAANFDTWHIYFDTDGDATNHLYFNGADYLLETDILYKYARSG